MEIIHILGDQEQWAGPAALQLHQGAVRRVGRHLAEPAPAFVVKALHQRGVASEGLGRGHVLDPMLLPQPAIVSEGGKATLGGDAGPGEDDNGRCGIGLH